jgi:hypothetical protein
VIAVPPGGVDQLAPAAIDLTARLRAAGEEAVGVHGRILGTIALRSVQLAPAHVKNLSNRVSIRLTPRAVCTRDGETVGQMVRHGSSRGAIAVTRLGPETNPLAFAI